MIKLLQKRLVDALDHRPGATTHFWKFLPCFFIPVTTWNFQFITTIILFDARIESHTSNYSTDIHNQVVIAEVKALEAALPLTTTDKNAQHLLSQT